MAGLFSVGRSLLHLNGQEESLSRSPANSCAAFRCLSSSSGVGTGRLPDLSGAEARRLLKLQ